MSLGFPSNPTVVGTPYVKNGRTWIWTGSAWQLQATLNGYVGSQGSGYVGSFGYTGSEGYWGSVGYSGSQGLRGLKGDSIKGDTGFTGSQGIAGEFAGKGYDGS